MKILLINQPWINNEKEYGLRAGVRWQQIRQRDRSMPYFPFPFFLAYATSFLTQEGFDATLRDSIALEESAESALQFVVAGEFDLVVMETSTPSIFHDIAFCNELKKIRPHLVICMTGQHSTAMPEIVLKESQADFVLIGEYEKTLANLARKLQLGLDTKLIKGLACRFGNLIINNGRETSIDFDTLPPPFRDPTLIKKYNEPSARFTPNASVMSSRGCSFKCTFCIEATLNYGKESSFRYRSIEKIKQEINDLVTNYGIREIFFDDAFFTPKRAEEIAELMAAMPWKIRWSCWIDRGATEDLLKKMHAAGCSGVKFGVETFDEKIGLGVKKRITPQSVLDLVARCNKVGLLTHASYIFGLPGEDKKSLTNTLQIAASLATTSFQFSIATPIPGTEFYEQVKAADWLITDDWRKFEGQGSSVLKYPDMNQSDLLIAMTRARKLKIIRLFKNPLALMYFLFKLARSLGFKGLVVDIFKKTVFVAVGK